MSSAFQSSEPRKRDLSTKFAQTTLTANLPQEGLTPGPSRTSVSSHDATLDHATAESRDLWATALQRLPEKDREELLGADQISQKNILEQISIKVRQQQQSFEAATFRINFRGRQIVPREIADRALTFVDKCKEIVDVAVSFDPVHAALPWAGIRFLLEVI